MVKLFIYTHTHIYVPICILHIMNIIPDWSNYPSKVYLFAHSISLQLGTRPYQGEADIVVFEAVAEHKIYEQLKRRELVS